MSPPLCVVLPPGMQTLFATVGLVRQLAMQRPVVLCTEVRHVKLLGRFFHDANVTFWFDEQDPACHARSLNMEVLVLSGDPRTMYASAKVQPRHMYSEWQNVMRDPAKEATLHKKVVNECGVSYILTWGCSVDKALLPMGIPIVNASLIGVDNPLDLCTLVEKALQVHANDGWFLTMTDLLGGNSKVFCHAATRSLCALAIRRKYRRRVSVVCRG